LKIKLRKYVCVNYPDLNILQCTHGLLYHIYTISIYNYCLSIKINILKMNKIGINLTKEMKFVYKTSLQGIKHDLTKWKFISCKWTRMHNIIKGQYPLK
jgi:hypothetical protein